MQDRNINRGPNSNARERAGISNELIVGPHNPAGLSVSQRRHKIDEIRNDPSLKQPKGQETRKAM